MLIWWEVSLGVDLVKMKQLAMACVECAFMLVGMWLFVGILILTINRIAIAWTTRRETPRVTETILVQESPYANEILHLTSNEEVISEGSKKSRGFQMQEP